MAVELNKMYTNECAECSEEFQTIRKDTKYCGNCGIAALVILTYKQLLANRWNITVQESRQWVREIARG